MKFRKEFDSIGSINVPNDKYWGASTQRSKKYFDIGDFLVRPILIKSIAIIKKAAAIVHLKEKQLPPKISNAIIASSNEVIAGKLDKHFPLKVWQTGSGTQTNMNVNEVIANRAIEKLGGKKGSKKPIHPNDHVNLSQSSNDTFPTIMHVAINELATKDLIPNLKILIKEFQKKKKIFQNIIKIGRTHTQDATPITLGDEFSAFCSQLNSCLKRIEIAKSELKYLAQGGTAVGSGINAPKKFDKVFCKYLNKLTNDNYKPSPNKFESLASHDPLINFSNSLKTLSLSLLKIINDIRFLASGPRSGLGELTLPANEPGSSIMPGKVNPTQIEALSMVCVQVIGNSTTVDFAGSNGHFQLNAYKPVIAFNIIQSVNLLSDGIKSFNNNCLKGLKANKEIINNHLNNSLMLVTALNKSIGYDNAAKIAKKAFNENLTLKDAALKLKLISEKDFDKIVDPKKMI